MTRILRRVIAAVMPLLLASFTDIYTVGIGTNLLEWAMPVAQLSSHGMAARILWDTKKKCWTSSTRAEDFKKGYFTRKSF